MGTIEMEDKYNSIIVHPDFNKTLKDLGKNIKKIPNPSYGTYDSDIMNFTQGNKKLGILDSKKLSKKKLDALNGAKFQENQNIYAYDESFAQYSSLEGSAYLTCHTLLHLTKKYAPINMITLNFYTGAKNMTKKSKFIKYSKNQELDSRIDYYNERIELLENVPDNSILLIDGPLIAGDAYVRFIKAMDNLNERGIITIFFVKNSGGTIIVDNIKDLKEKSEFNNDMHWSYQFLKGGEVTNFFHYTDPHNKSNSRAFCFLKAYKNLSPQRVEFHIDTYKKFKMLIPNILDMIYYFLLVQGNPNNLQLRPIAIAEMYARESLKLFDINRLLKSAGITPSMNQVRGFTF